MKKGLFNLECSNFECRHSPNSEGTIVEAETLAELVEKDLKCRLCGSDLILTDEEKERINKAIGQIIKNNP